MSERKIYACLDIDNRRVVKGRKFQGVEEIADPLELAERYAAEGADALVFYDIAASIQGRDLFWDLITAIRQQIAIPFIVGGGIRTVQDAQRAFDAGADQVSVNSGALRSPELIRQIAERFGSEKVLLSMDVKRTEDGSWKVFDKAGTEDTGIDALDWADTGSQQGAGGLVVNCIDTDGMQSGYELELTDRIAKSVDIPVIASGGAGKAGHITELFEQTAAQGALVASVLHYGLVSLPELQEAKSSAFPINTVKWGADGLIPAIIQDALTGDVLTLAYMNEEALARTAATRETWLYSRSRQELWRKGATSGNTQQVLQIDVDCDRDAVLLQVTPSGPSCHTGERTCFTRQAGKDLRERRSVLPDLYREIGLRKTSPQEGSYTAYLFREGIDKILKKVGEETAEVIIAAKNENRTELREELADLTYHLCVLLQAMETAPEEILDVLRQRRKAGRCAP